MDLSHSVEHMKRNVYGKLQTRLRVSVTCKSDAATAATQLGMYDGCSSLHLSQQASACPYLIFCEISDKLGRIASPQLA